MNSIELGPMTEAEQSLASATGSRRVTIRNITLEPGWDSEIDTAELLRLMHQN